MKVQLDDLRSATYTVVNYTEQSGPAYMFIASFNIERLQYDFAIVDANWIEVKTFDQLEPNTIANYGIFVGKMMGFVSGDPHPYTESIVANSPDIQSPFDVAKDSSMLDDSDLDEDEASLK